MIDKCNNEFIILAGKLFIARRMLDIDSLLEADKDYCLDLFYYDCIVPLLGYGAIVEPGDAMELYGSAIKDIINLSTEFQQSRHDFYRGAREILSGNIEI